MMQISAIVFCYPNFRDGERDNVADYGLCGANSLMQG